MNKSRTFRSYLNRAQQPRAEPCTGLLQCNFQVRKSDDEARLVFGWASIAERANGETVVDWQEDIVEIDELESAAYDFVQFYREGSEMHERGGHNIATLVESMVFTQEKLEALGIAAGTIPYGWWVGFRVNDESVWRKVKDGTYTMFSIEGEAIRQQV